MSEPRAVRIRVDLNKCAGSTMCVQIAPLVFGLNDARQADVLDEDGDGVAKIRKAAEACPQGAIILVDSETGERVFP